MKNNDYYGLGISENGLWKTEDNGKTWDNITNGSFSDCSGKFGRIIFCSKENKGITYSDDEGITREETNIKTGNWEDAIYSHHNYFSISSDGDGVWYSIDNGKTWEKLVNGIYHTADRVNNIVYFGGDDILADEYGNLYFGNKNIISKDNINSIPNRFFINENGVIDINGLLLYILNQIIGPKIYMETTGKSFDNDIKDYATLVKKSDTYYMNVNNYKNKNYLLDFEEDVGMKKFNFDINDVIGESDNIIINSNFSDDNETMKKTMKKVKKFIEIKKNNYINNIFKAIENVKIDNSNILSIVGASTEEISDAIEIEDLYESVSKSSVKTIMYEIYNRIFNFPDYKIRELIFLGIFEELNFLSGLIRNKLVDISKSIHNEEELKNKLSHFKIKYSFERGFKIAFKKYSKILLSYIKEMSLAEDEEFKYEAISNYRENREKYIKEAELKVYNMIPEVNYGTIFYNQFDNLYKDIAEVPLSEGYKNIIIEKITNFNLNISDEDLKKFVVYTYKGMVDKMQKININFNLNTEQYKENTDYKDILKILNYSNAIQNEFNKRCSELLYYVYNNYINEDEIIKNMRPLLENQLIKEKNRYIYDINSTITDEEAFNLCKDRKIDMNYCYSEIKDIVFKILRDEWVTNEEML